MKGLQTENIVIILDQPPPTGKRDSAQKWISTLSKAISLYLEEKQKIDPADRVMILWNGEEICKIGSLETSVEALRKLVDKTNFSVQPKEQSHTEIITALLKTAVDQLSVQIKQLGDQSFRILLITHHIQWNSTEIIDNILKTAIGLKISIDVCIFHEEKDAVDRESFLTLTNPTRGEFGHFFKDKALFNAMKGFASKRIQDDPSTRLISPPGKEEGKFLAELAGSLQVPSPEFIQKLETDKGALKCQVCFGIKCPAGGHDFGACGRLCPNCGRPIHIHCAGLWAQKAAVAPNLFRCPSCYTLLKLAPSVEKGIRIREGRKSKSPPPINIKMVRVKEETLGKSEEICGFCFKGFSPQNPPAEQKVFQCSQCGAHYHTECLEKMYKSSKSCQNCNGLIQ